MVKNFGGNKSKKQGRKFVGDPKASKALRLPETSDEIIATIIKIYGHGMSQSIRSMTRNLKAIRYKIMVLRSWYHHQDTNLFIPKQGKLARWSRS